MTDPHAPQEGAQPYQPPQYQPSQYQPPQAPSSADPYAPPTGDPYGAPTGDPYGAPPAGGYGAPPLGTPYQPVPPKKRRVGLTIAVVLVAALVVCAGAVFLVARLGGAKATNANEGDCLAGDAITGTQQTTAALKIVKCDAKDARYKVVAKIPDKKESEAVDSLCIPYAPKGAEIIYWQEKSVGSGVGNVLCLGNAK